MKNIIVIVPSLSPTGPIKGAIGLVNGLDELGAEAKQYLASGEATKGNASQMIDKLKDALS